MKKYIFLMILCLLFVIGCEKEVTPSKKILTCTKDVSKETVPVFQTLNFSFVDDKLDTFDINVSVNISDIDKSLIDNFVENVKSMYEEQYKDYSNAKVNVSKKSDKEIFIEVSLDYKNMSEEEKNKLGYSEIDNYEAIKSQHEENEYTCN